MSGELERKRDSERSSDVEELREVLKAISEFLTEIREPLENLVKTVIEASSGEKLAKEVAAFYKSLIESGIDQQTAREWTEKFFTQRLESLPSFSFLKDIFGGPRRALVKSGQEAEKKPQKQSE